jgi:AcrR family transcriptional regulator
MNGKEKIVQQSKHWLVESLLDLLKQESYQKITVKAIALNADLSRRTFYRFFKNKDDLLKYYGICLINEYWDFIKNQKDITFAQMLNAFFNFWWDRRNNIHVLIKQNLFIPLLTQVTKQTSKYVRIYDVNFGWHVNNISASEENIIMEFLQVGIGM